MNETGWSGFVEDHCLRHGKIGEVGFQGFVDQGTGLLRRCVRPRIVHNEPGCVCTQKLFIKFEKSALRV